MPVRPTWSSIETNYLNTSLMWNYHAKLVCIVAWLESVHICRAQSCRLQPNALDVQASGMYDKWRYIKVVLGVSHLITSVVATRGGGTHNSHVTYKTVSNLAVSARTLAVIMCATDYRVVTIWLAQSCPPRPLLYFTFLSSPLSAPSRPSLFIALPPDYLLRNG